MSYPDPRLPSRPPSEQLVDLHVYVVPGDVWVEHLRLVYNEAVKDTVSAGFVRVFPDVTIYNLREEIEEQLGFDVIPKDYIFLRGVGRALTQVKGRQEFQLKVKNFVPPLALVPEIYVIEGSLVLQSPRALPAIGHRYSEPGTSRSTASDNPLDRSQVFSDPPPGRSHLQRRKDFEPLRNSDEFDSQRTDHDRLGNKGRRRDDHREAFVTQADAAKLLSTNLDQSAFSPDNDDSSSSPQNLKDSGYNTTPRNSQEYDEKTPKRRSERSPDGRSRAHSPPSPSPERTSYPQTRPQSRSTPLSATPPASPLTSNPSPGQKVHKLDRSRAGSRAATYTSQTNEDSGIAEEDSRTLDRRKREEERQRREAEERRREEEERQRQEEDRREEEERRRREEEERWRRQRVRDEDEPSETRGGRGRGYDDYDDDDQSDARSQRSDLEGGQTEETFSFRWPEQQGGGSKVEETFIGDDLLASFAAAREEQKQRRQEKEKELRLSQEEEPDSEGQVMPRVFGVGKGEERHQNKEYAWENTSRTGGDKSSERGSFDEGTTRSYRGDDDNYADRQSSQKEMMDSRHGDDPSYGGGKGMTGSYHGDEESYRGGKGMTGSYHGDEESYRGGKGMTGSYHGDEESYRGGEGMSVSYHSNDSNKGGDDDDAWPGEKDHEKRGNQSQLSSDGNQLSSLGRSGRESEGRQRASTEASNTTARSPTKEKEAQNKKARSRSNSPQQQQVARFPSPPPLELPSPRDGGKTDRSRASESPKRSTRSNREKGRSSGAGGEKDDLIEELERIREERKIAEKKREEMVKKAKQLQSKTQHRRNQARDIWKKRYFEEKKKTTPLEENCNRLRAELDMTHRKLMSKLEGDRDGKRRFNVNTDPPSSKNNQKVQLTRIQHELDDLKEKVENAKMKLTSEMKLRNQAETELRALRAELTQKKIHAALTRNQHSNIMHSMDKVQPGYMPAKVMPPT
ncbi:caldesmon-like [Branchiostoma lanceolatum]|uniref:caldesmon-like n=1 Tax=Branchiostoma lanceolatum TaxID=7740 RepID=UPI0034557A70